MPVRPSLFAAIFALASFVGCNSKWDPIDLDGDGYTLLNGDCDEGSASINPDAIEVWYNGFDENCDANDGDQDGDGFVPQSYADNFPSWADRAGHLGVGDCWDDPTEAYDAGYTSANGGTERPSAPTVNPDAAEVWYDGVDADCSGGADFDQDGDGYNSAWHLQADGSVGDDCVDGSTADETFTDEDGNTVEITAAGFTAATIHPGVTDDLCYDGIDADCSGVSDYDCDEDGYARRDECDDSNAAIYPNPSVDEVWYNGVDENCDGNDGDQDGDGYVPDSVIAIYTGLGTTWDEFSAHVGVGDCWDDPTDLPADYYPSLNGLPNLDAADVHPTATDIAYDGVDADCQADTDFDNDNDGEDSSEFEQRDGSLGPDCDDGEPAVNTGATEDCGTTIDDNCDGSDNDANAIGCVTFYYDDDRDNYGTTSGRCLCEAEGDYRSGANTDCNDSSATVYPGATEVTADGIDQDCSGGDTCYLDSDNDDYGNTSTTVSADLDCTDSGESPVNTDCNANDATVYPGATEIVADGINQDCSSGDTCYQDTDLDGYGSSSTVVSSDLDCTDGGESAVNTDCNTSVASIYPGATEVVADGIDQDCSGGDTCYQDTDNDDYGSTTTRVSTDLDCTDSQEASVNTDCNDNSASINPGATEVTADGIDQNCNNGDVCYRDNDGDTYGTSTTISSTDLDCVDSLEANDDDDCNDSSATVYPGATEVVADGIDQDCASGDTCYVDSDGDTYGSTSTVVSSDLDCTDSGESRFNTDCNTSVASIYPGATEVTADGIDQDCASGDTCYVDSDGDGYGSTSTVVSADLDCSDSGESSVNTDCNTSVASIYPGATEVVADGIDQNCNGGDVCYQNLDSDTYGSTTTVTSSDLDCTDSGESSVSTDCYDAASSTEANTTFPGVAASETNASACMTDIDNDNYGDSSPRSGVTAGTDCFDDNSSEGAATFPGVAASETNASACMTDIDNDNYGDDSPRSGVTAGTDCDDALDTISPGDQEICDVDDTDEDCDGLSDDDDPNVGSTGMATFYRDVDGDTYGVSTPTDDRCDEGGGYVDNTDDCDDGDIAINPAADDDCTESVMDSTQIDDDCDGIVDEGNAADGACYEGGELAISEIMYDSSMSTDTDGEWFEVYNTTLYDIDMMGMRIRRATTTNATFYVSDHVVVPAGGFAVFCYDDATLSANDTLCDYIYGSNQGLTNEIGAAATYPSYNTSFNLPDATAVTLTLVISGYGDSEMSEVTLDTFSFTGGTAPFNSGNPGISVEAMASTVNSTLATSNNTTSTNWVLAYNTSSYLYYDSDSDGTCETAEACEYGTPTVTSSH